MPFTNSYNFTPDYDDLRQRCLKMILEEMTLNEEEEPMGADALSESQLEAALGVLDDFASEWAGQLLEEVAVAESGMSEDEWDELPKEDQLEIRKALQLANLLENDFCKEDVAELIRAAIA